MLRIGLLQCDNLDEPHVLVDGDYDVLYTKLLARSDVEVVAFDAHQGELPTSVNECDAWLIPGARHSVYDDIDWLTDLKGFVATLIELQMPLIGICFGHQLIGSLLGAPVAKAEVGWQIGARDYRLATIPEGEGESAGSFTVVASHQDQVLDLPEGADLFASADGCPIAGFTVGNYVFCVQGHPEFSAELARSLYSSRVERIGAAPVSAALATLDRPLDRSRVGDWIVDFVRSSRV